MFARLKKMAMFMAPAVLLCLLLSPVALSQNQTAATSDSKQDRKKQRRILAESIAVPRGVTELQRNAYAEEITFKSRQSIRELAEFYQRHFKKLNWITDDDFDEDDEDVDLDFEKGNKDITVELELDDETNVVSVTIDGDGINWKNARSKMVGFDTDDIPLLDNQGRSLDGSTELFQFNSRKSVDDNIKHFQSWMKSKGWQLSAAEKKRSATLLRFEKDKLFIRIGLWPHSFSDNYGKHDGTGGAMTGTGLYWSGRQGVADVPRRMASEAEKLLGLTPAKRELLMARLRQQIEQTMVGEAGRFKSS